MILHTIRLQNVGRITAPVTTGLLSSGLNVLCSPNETGKSTMLRAVTRALFDKYNGKSGELRAMQPAGTDLAPQVTVEFSTGSGRFRIEKKFLVTPASTLSEWRGDTWHLIAENDEADARVLDLAGGEKNRGVSRPEHWGFINYLWARQDSPASWPLWEGGTGSTIRAGLTRVSLDPTVERLEKLMVAETSAVFTSTGRTKKSGPLYAVETSLEEIGQQLSEIRQKRQVLEEDQHTYRSLTIEVSSLEEHSQTLEKESTALDARHQEIQLLRKEIETLEQNFKAAKIRLQKVSDHLCTYERATETILEQEATLQKKSDYLQKISAEEKSIGTDIETTTTEKQKISAERDTALAEIKKIRDSLSYRELEEEIRQQSTKLEEASKLTASCDRSRATLDALPPLDPASLAQIKETETGLHKIEARLEALGIRVKITPEEEQTIHTPDGPITLEAGVPQALHAPRSLELSLPGWGKIAITSGATGIGETEKSRDRLKGELQKSLHSLGVTSVAGAEQILEKRRSLKGELTVAQNSLSAVLGDNHTDTSSLQNSLSTKKTQLAKLTPPEGTHDLQSLKQHLEKLDQATSKISATVEEHGQTLDSLRSKLTSLREDREDHRLSLSKTEGTLSHLREQKDTILADYPEGVAPHKAIAQEDFVAAEAKLDTSRRKLPTDWENLTGKLEETSRRAKSTRTRLTELQNRRLQLETKLNLIGSDGLYDRESTLLERQSSKRDEANTLRQRAGAAAFLNALITRQKQATISRVITPLEDEISTAFAELTGDKRRRIFLDDTLDITGTGCQRDDSLIPFSALSQGAKEQLLLALRAAIARGLNKSSPQLLILDDVLVNTDPERQKRVLKFLRTLSEEIQILILTCHPNLYQDTGEQLSLHPVP